MNVPWRNEPMATDTIQSETPAIDGGEKYAQFFVGVRSLLSDVHGMKSPASFIMTMTAHFPPPARNAMVDGWVSVKMWPTS
jgi:hypothetical protein